MVIIVNGNVTFTFEIEKYNKQRDEFCSIDNFKHLCTKDLLDFNEIFIKIMKRKIQMLIKTKRKEFKRQQMFLHTMRKHFLDRYF